jgi:hypothetical protein
MHAIQRTHTWTTPKDHQKQGILILVAVVVVVV